MLVLRYAQALGRFWYDFIVGDSAFLAIGGPLALVAAYLFRGMGLVEVLVPAIVVATIVVSLRFR